MAFAAQGQQRGDGQRDEQHPQRDPHELGRQIHPPGHLKLRCGRAQRHPCQAQHGQHQYENPQGFVPHDVVSSRRVHPLAHQSTEATRAEDERNGHDDGREPVEDLADAVIAGSGRLMHCTKGAYSLNQKAIHAPTARRAHARNVGESFR